jgi:predicted MFS family arabinose efflux permease
VASLLLGLQTADDPRLAGVLYAVAAALVPVFIWQERRAREPLMPLWLFGRRAIGVSTLGGLLLGWALYGQSTFLPPYVQGVMGATPTVSGFILAGSSVSWPVASSIGGRVLLRLGFRAPCVAGGILLTVGFALLLFVTPESSLLVPLAITGVLGLGFGFYAVTTILAAQSAVGWEHRGVVTSASQFSRNIGGTIGVSIAGALFTAGVMQASLASVNPNNLLSPTVRAGLSPQALAGLQELLAGSLRSVYALFVAVSAAATAIALFLPGGPPTQVSDAGLEAQLVTSEASR